MVLKLVFEIIERMFGVWGIKIEDIIESEKGGNIGVVFGIWMFLFCNYKIRSKSILWIY